MDHCAFLRQLFDCAIAAADPLVIVPQHLPPRPRGRLVVLGAGKASANMARVVEDYYGAPLEGIVVTRYGHAVSCKHIEIIEAAHPKPDSAGEYGAQRVLELARTLGPDDLGLCLISGGGSSLLSLPAPGLTLAHKQAINSALLRSGAPISAMNVVRKHLSAIKGGWLAAAAYPAKLLTLIISDVPGDDPASVASGPTIGDPSTFAQAREILHKYKIDEPRAVIEHLERRQVETPKPGDPRLSASVIRIIATAQMSLEAGAKCAREAGVAPIILGDAIEGEARDIGRQHAMLALRRLQEGQRPCVFLSGGETSVTMRAPDDANARGGRNSEYLLALALALESAPGAYALAADTDGIDGMSEHAGAMITPDTLSRARTVGLDPALMLEENNSGGLFEALGDCVTTGATLTNVNDFRAILIT